MKKRDIYIIIFISLLTSCSINYQTRIQGTWFHYGYYEKFYNEISFYKNKLYISSSGLGPTERFYKINNDSITIYGGDYEDTVKYKYIFDKNKVILINKSRNDTLRKSAIQVKEDDYQTYSKEKLFFLKDKIWERMQLNLELMADE